MTTTTEPRRFFYVHMQKTAGTALFRRLKQQFSPAEVYPNDTDGSPPDSVLMIDHLAQRWAVRGHEIRVLTGHFPLCTTEVLGVPFTTLTVLREPVERTLSFLRHLKKKSPGFADTSLEELYEEPIRFHGLVENHMTKMLCLAADDMPGYAMTHVHFDRSHLERAIERLSTVDVVGVQRRFEDFCDELVERFDWNLGESIHANRTDPIPVEDAFRSRIAEDSALDMELYEHAERLVAERRGPG